MDDIPISYRVTKKEYQSLCGPRKQIIVAFCADLNDHRVNFDDAADHGSVKKGQIMGKLIQLGMLTLLAVACSSGAQPGETRGPIDNGEGSEGEGGAGGSDGAVVECEPALPDESLAEFLCDPAGDLACNNCHDCGRVMDGSAKAEAVTCGIQCGSSRSCAEDCLTDNIGLSSDCTGCLVDFFDCLKANCLAPCVGNTPDECTECSRTEPAGVSCSEALETCSGAVRNDDFSG